MGPRWTMNASTMSSLRRRAPASSNSRGVCAETVIRMGRFLSAAWYQMLVIMAQQPTPIRREAQFLPPLLHRDRRLHHHLPTATDAAGKWRVWALTRFVLLWMKTRMSWLPRLCRGCEACGSTTLYASRRSDMHASRRRTSLPYDCIRQRHSDLSTIRCVIESASPLVSLIRFRSRLCSYEMHWANCALLKLRMPRQEPPLSVLSEVCQLLMLRMKAAICGGCISIEG
mmetsp:Transcript_19567/g.59217  ORF Transcript_19567/g.59217 Transcript_19567/m.59217 type:complete len:228 (-) Transcript_19567:801-1484(-)